MDCFKNPSGALDTLHLALPDLRAAPEEEIENLFLRACRENLKNAVAWMFYARDVRGGLGERRVFRVCLRALSWENTPAAVAVLPLVPEYGRWDDLWGLLTSPVARNVMLTAAMQLTGDIRRVRSGARPSMLSKWMPSENASSDERRKQAFLFMEYLSLRPREYRFLLSTLRQRLLVPERDMSLGNWRKIAPGNIAAGAARKYRQAFLRHGVRAVKSPLPPPLYEPAPPLYEPESTHEIRFLPRYRPVLDALEAAGL